MPPETFDSLIWIPYQTVGLGAQPSWQLSTGNAQVSGPSDGFNGGQALRLPVDRGHRTKLTRAVTWDVNEKTAFIDFRIKPAADPTGSYSSFSVNGTQLAFQVPTGSPRGEIWVLNGADGPGTPNANPTQWIKTAGSFEVSGTSATEYFRVTLRQDYSRNLWDLFVGGKLVAVNLAFDGRAANLTAIDFYGSQIGDTLVDELSAQTGNMLFTDSDKDGLPDNWEIANGSNPFLYDREAINPLTGKSFLDAYLDSLWPSGIAPTNAANIVPPTAGIPPLTILGQHQAVGALKGSLSVSGDGSASYSVPIDVPKGTGGMEPKLSLNYSSNGANGVMGLGWSLGGLQAITRGPSSAAKDGEFDPMDFDTTDRFFLDGERLVCVEGTYGAPNSEYRTEIDSFARITAIGGSLGAGPATWKLETKAGLIVKFGGTADSKNSVPQGTLSWAVNRVEDTVGNYYQINYKNDANTADFDFVNQRVESIDYTGNDAQGLDPYCHVVFDYEVRPDVTRSFSKYAGSRNTKRLSRIRVITQTSLNHSYVLSYDKSYQSQRSRLISIGKEVPGGAAIALPPTTFTYDGLDILEPLWKSPGSTSLPVYGSGLDATGSVNSMVTVNDAKDTIRLTGDVSRAYKLPATGVKLYPDSRIRFEFNSAKLVSGAFIGLDSDTTYQSAATTNIYRIGGNGSAVKMADGMNFAGSTKAYAPSEDWKIISADIGKLGTGWKQYLILMCVDNDSTDGIDSAVFRNIRIYRTGTQTYNDVAPIEFKVDTEMPRFEDSKGRDLGIVTADFDSDGLPDLADWRAISFSRDGSNRLTPNTVGQVYRNNGGTFSLSSALRPPTSLPLSVRKLDENANAYNEKHHLTAQPIDVDGDGKLDLLGSMNIISPSGSIQNEYMFYTFIDGAWTEKTAWRLPFNFSNVTSSGTGGSVRDQHFQWVDLNSDGYQDLVIYTSGRGRLYNKTTGNLMVDGDSSVAFLNKGKNGPGWTRDDSGALPLPLQDDGQDVGRRIVDLDGDGVPEFIKSRYQNGNGLFQRTYFLKKPGTQSTGSSRWKCSPDNDVAGAHTYDLPSGLVVSNGSPTGALLVDLNGDGLVDFLNSKKDGSAFSPSTWINQGSKWANPWQSENSAIGLYAPMTGYSYRFSYPLNYDKSGYNVAAGYELADLNGDGLIDILYSDVEDPASIGGNNFAAINTGNGWFSNFDWGLPNTTRIFSTVSEREEGKRRAKLQDVDGDGFPDLITGLLDQTPKVWFNNCRTEVLKSVTDGFGSTLSVNYKRLNDPAPTVNGFRSIIYEKSNQVLSEGIASVIDARLVVSSYSEPNGLGGTKNVHQRYGDLRYDRRNEASLGFGWIETLDSLTGQISRTVTYRDYPFAGSPAQVTVSVPVTDADRLGHNRLPGVSSGLKILSREVSLYDELPSTNGVGGKIRRPVQTWSSKIIYGLNGIPISNIATEQALANFDSFGFVKKSTSSTMDRADVITESTYDHSTTGKWLLGRLRSAKVTKTDYVSPAIIRNSEFTYHPSTGLLSSETVEPGNPKSVTKSYARDGFGNVISSAITAEGKTRTATSSYGESPIYKGRFVRSATNSLGQTVSSVYDDLKSTVKSVTDIGGLTTSFVYDPYGTLTCTNHPDGTATGEITGWANNASVPAAAPYLSGEIKLFRAKQASGSFMVKVYLDSLGRELCAESTILRNAGTTTSNRYSTIYTVTKYDYRGRKNAASEPFAAGETPLFTYIEYDFLNRVVRTTHPDGTADYAETFDTSIVGGTQSTIYSKTRARDGKALERWEDQHGRLIQSRDPSGQLTTFGYNQDDKLTTVSINEQLLLTNRFDLFGNKVSVTEANSGTSSSIYSGFGEVTSSTNAKGQTTEFTYDNLGRPVTVSKPEGFYTTAYDGAIGNGKGKPWKTTGADGYGEEVTYDSLGRTTATRKTQFGETSYTSVSYDVLGRVYGEIDAGGLGVIHKYDGSSSIQLALELAPGGNVGAGTVLWKAGTYDSKGRTLTQTLAQGVTASATYFANTGLLDTLRASSSTGEELQNKSCAWASQGNLITRTDFKAARSESFAYDGLNRLTTATTVALSGSSAAVPPPTSYSYDLNGNLKTKAADTLTYGGSRPHAVTTATIKGQQRGYSYDAAGYVTSDSKRDYSWTSFGQLGALDYLTAPALQNLANTQIFTAARVQTSFFFDAGGNRAKQLKKRIAADSSRELEETLYLGSYEREIHSSQASGSATPKVKKVVHRHTLGGLGVYTQTTSSTGIETKLTTILKDHLGSTDLLYTGVWNGNSFANPQTEKQAFDPWGERRNAETWQNERTASTDAYRTSGQGYDRGYTGHEQLDDSGLIHMNGRIYDPELGRMLSPDPVVQVPEYSQNFNRYSYVMNNPMNTTDPTGFSWLGNAFHKMGSWLKANWQTVVVIVVVAVLTYFTAGAASVWGASLYASATGVAATSTAATFVGGAIAGGYIGAVAGGLGAALNGGNVGDVLRGGLIGGIQGAITGGFLHGMEQASGTYNAQTALHIAGHGVVGGAANVAMGGKFGDGFLSAAASAGASDAGLLGDSNASGSGAFTSRTIRSGIVGGTASALGGGKFANGAYTSAFQYLLNHEMRALTRPWVDNRALRAVRTIDAQVAAGETNINVSHFDLWAIMRSDMYAAQDFADSVRQNGAVGNILSLAGPAGDGIFMRWSRSGAVFNFNNGSSDNHNLTSPIRSGYYMASDVNYYYYTFVLKSMNPNTGFFTAKAANLAYNLSEGIMGEGFEFRNYSFRNSIGQIKPAGKWSNYGNSFYDQNK